MIRAEEHTLTEQQLALIEEMAEFVLTSNSHLANTTTDTRALEDLLETLDTDVHGSKRTVTVRYIIEEPK